MKTLTDKFNGLSDMTVGVLAILITLLLTFLLGFFVMWPSFNSLSGLSQELETERGKVAVIDGSIANLKAQDKDTLSELKVFLQQYVPEAVDDLHFATLNEAVSTAAGVTVNNIQISKGAPNAAKTTPTQPTTAAAAGTTATTQAVQAAPVTVAVTYTSNFDSLLRLISYWSLADQLVGIKEVNISGVSGADINYTINYELPTSGVVQKAVIEDRLSLTKEQKERLLELRDKIIYTATPSANSVGKSNPFN